MLITGLAPITPIGIGREDFLAGLAEGRVGIRPPERIEVGDTGVQNVAECLDFYVEDYLESEKTYLDRASELLLAACHLALTDGSLDARGMDHERIGLSIGTAYGCLGTMAEYYRKVLEKGAKFASTVLFTHTYANTPISLASIEYGIMGPTNTVCTGVTSGAGALCYAFDLLRHGRTDAMLAGGMDALCQPLFDGLAAEGLLGAGDPKPMDAQRDGFCLGEGAGLVLVERAQCAEARGATPLARLMGHGMAQGGAEAVAAAAKAALADAAVSTADVGCVITGASGSVKSDAEELTGLAQAWDGSLPPVTTLKGTIGETLAASAILSLSAAVHVLQGGRVPPVRGLSRLDPALPNVTPVLEPTCGHASQPLLISSLDDTGNCVCLVVGAP